MRYVWDSAKAAANVRNHGVSFVEAVSALADPHALDRQDEAHPERINTIGMSDRGRLLFVVSIVSAEPGRIISARRVTAHERKRYEEEES